LGTQYPDLHADLRLVYGGDRAETRNGVHVIPWERIQEAEW